MFSNSTKTDGFSYVGTTRPAIAKRQLQTSIGAVAVIAVIAVGMTFSVRGSFPPAGEQMTHATAAPIIVKAAVRMVPSERLQAADQTRADRRS